MCHRGKLYGIALCQRQGTSGPAEVSPEQLEALPPALGLFFLRYVPPIGAKGTGEERVRQRRKSWDWRKPLGEKKMQRGEEDMVLLKSEPPKLCAEDPCSQGAHRRPADTGA